MCPARTSVLIFFFHALLASVSPANANENDDACKFDDGDGTYKYDGSIQLVKKCTCGKEDCGVKSYCYPWSADGKTGEPKCRDSPICTIDVQNQQLTGFCYCDEMKCSVKEGAYCTKQFKLDKQVPSKTGINQGGSSTSAAMWWGCQKYPYCPAEDGSTKGSGSCRCGNVLCETDEDNDYGVGTGLYCHNRDGKYRCQKIGTCKHKDGLERNSEACQCGNGQCSEASGPYCTACDYPYQRCKDKPVWDKSTAYESGYGFLTPQSTWECPSSATSNPSCKSRQQHVDKIENTLLKEDELKIRRNQIKKEDARKKWKGLDYNQETQSCKCTSEEVDGRCRHAPCLIDDFNGNAPATENPMACRCNNTDCDDSTGLYCNRLEWSDNSKTKMGRCRKAPCLYTDGLTANDEDCSCGKTDCLQSTNKLVCNNVTSVCDYPQCTNNDGTLENPKPCWCGAKGLPGRKLSNEKNGKYCFDPAIFAVISGPQRTPSCTTQDGSAQNTLSCVCNNTKCILGKEDKEGVKEPVTGETTGMHCYADTSQCAICPLGKYLDPQAGLGKEGRDWGVDTKDEFGQATDTPDTLVEYACRFCPAGYSFEGEMAGCQACPQDTVQPASQAYFPKCKTCDYYAQDGIVSSGHLGWFHTGNTSEPCDIHEQGYPIWGIAMGLTGIVALISYAVMLLMRSAGRGKAKPKAIALVPVSANGSAA